MNNPLFSIIIPVCNLEDYISDCINSIINQQFLSYELILIDDGSTDSSLSIMKLYEEKYERIKVLSQKNQGVSVARNIGLRHATGRYVWFVDADDYIDTQALKTLYNYITNEPKLDIIIVGASRVIGSHKVIMYQPNIKYSNIDGSNLLIKMFKEHFYITAICFFIFNREFLEKKGLEFIKEKKYEDELFVPLALHVATNVGLIAESLYSYRLRNNSATRQPHTYKHFWDCIHIADQLQKAFFTLDVWDAFKERIFHLYIKSYKRMLISNVTDDGIMEFARSKEYLIRLKKSKKTLKQKTEYLLLSLSAPAFRLYTIGMFKLRKRIRPYDEE